MIFFLRPLVQPPGAGGLEDERLGWLGTEYIGPRHITFACAEAAGLAAKAASAHYIKSEVPDQVAFWRSQLHRGLCAGFDCARGKEEAKI